MWRRLSFRARIFLLLIALVGATLTGGLVTIWHTRAMNALLVSLIDKNLASFQAAEELTNSLSSQKGFLTYYFLDGNPDWLKQMEQHREDFGEWLQKARKSAYTEPMAQLLRQIDAGFGAYDQSRQQVIDLYREGSGKPGPGCTRSCAASLPPSCNFVNAIS